MTSPANTRSHGGGGESFVDRKLPSVCCPAVHAVPLCREMVAPIAKKILVALVQVCLLRVTLLVLDGLDRMMSLNHMAEVFSLPTLNTCLCSVGCFRKAHVECYASAMLDLLLPNLR